MINLQLINEQNVPLFLTVVLWELVWKGIALWKAAGHKQRNWFVALLIVNSLGVLPLIYIQFFQKKRPASKKGK